MPLNVLIIISEYHKLSIIRSEEFIKVMENKKNNIANEIHISGKKQVIENRSILRPIIETLFVNGKQNVQFVLLYFVTPPPLTFYSVYVPVYMYIYVCIYIYIYIYIYVHIICYNN